MAKTPSRSRRSPRTPRWLVCFTFDRPRTSRTGSFQIVVDAATPDDAMALCHVRLENLRRTTRLFDEAVTIYADGLIRLDGAMRAGVLVNWQTNTPSGRVSNLLPDPEVERAVVFTAEDGGDKPFIRFAGKEARPKLTALH